MRAPCSGSVIHIRTAQLVGRDPRDGRDGWKSPFLTVEWSCLKVYPRSNWTYGHWDAALSQVMLTPSGSRGLGAQDRVSWPTTSMFFFFFFFGAT